MMICLATHLLSYENTECEDVQQVVQQGWAIMAKIIITIILIDIEIAIINSYYYIIIIWWH